MVAIVSKLIGPESAKISGDSTVGAESDKDRGVNVPGGAASGTLSIRDPFGAGPEPRIRGKDLAPNGEAGDFPHSSSEEQPIPRTVAGWPREAPSAFPDTVMDFPWLDTEKLVAIEDQAVFATTGISSQRGSSCCCSGG